MGIEMGAVEAESGDIVLAVPAGNKVRKVNFG
jgi:hypothetical protein